MIASLYQLRKSRNSTRAPDPKNVQFKIEGKIINGTDILSPTLQFAINYYEHKTVMQNNYLYLDELKRYYFIDRWAWMDGFLTAYCSVDVLATYDYKDGVYDRLQFYARADKDNCNTQAPQDFPLAGYRTHSGGVFTDLFTLNPAECTFMVGMITPKAGERGSVDYKMMNITQLDRLMKQLMQKTDWLDINTQEISQSLSKMLFNPIQYIKDIFMIPIPEGILDPTAPVKTGLQYGWWKFPDIVYRENTKTIYKFEQLYTLPEHPQYKTDNSRAYLERAPFTSRSLYVPGFPLVDCSPIYETNYARNVNIVINLDITTGSCIMDLSTPVDTPPVMGSWRIDVPLSQITQNVTGVIGGVANMVGGAVGNLVSLDFGGAVDSIIGGAISTLNAMAPTLSNVGNTDKSFAPFARKGYIETIWKLQATPDYSKIGYPAFKTLKMANIKRPTFVQTINAKFEPQYATFEEIDMLNRAFNEGVYLET